MPNNAFQLKCGNKIIYHGRPRPVESNPDIAFAPGLGIHENCCRCKCPCQVNCEDLLPTDWFDQFEQSTGTPPYPEYIQDGDNWQHTGDGFLRLQAPGTSTLLIEGGSNRTDITVRLEGRIKEVGDNSSEIQNLGIKLEGNVGTALPFTCNVTAKHAAGVSDYVEFSVVIGDAEEWGGIVEWDNLPAVLVGIRLIYDAEKDAVDACILVGNTSLQREILTVGGNGTFNAIKSSIYGEANNNSANSVEAGDFCCPRDASCGASCTWFETFYDTLPTDIFNWDDVNENWYTFNGYLRCERRTDALAPVFTTCSLFLPNGNQKAGVKSTLGPMDLSTGTNEVVLAAYDSDTLYSNIIQIKATPYSGWEYYFFNTYEGSISEVPIQGDVVDIAYNPSSGLACFYLNGVLKHENSVGIATRSKFRVSLLSRIPEPVSLNVTYAFWDEICTEQIPEGASLPLIRTNKPGSFIYSVLIRIAKVPATKCPRLYDLKSLDVKPADWWNEENQELVLKYMQKETKKLKLQYNEGFCRRLIKLAAKLAKKGTVST